MNTSLGEKPLFPLVENSGEDKGKQVNESADQLFYSLYHFSHCAIDFVSHCRFF